GLVVDHSSNSNAKHMLNCPTIRTGLLVENQVICRTQLTSCLVLEDPVPSKVVLDNPIEATLVDNRPPMALADEFVPLWVENWYLEVNLHMRRSEVIHILSPI